MSHRHTGNRLKTRVGIDLAPASLTDRAPGTARLVAEQARALFQLDLPWQWVPVVESPDNPLWPEAEPFSPLVVGGRSVAARATLGVGDAWQRAGCQIGYATTCFVPLRGPRVVSNLFDSNLYEHGRTWIESGHRRQFLVLRLACAFAIRRARKLFVLSEYCRRTFASLFPRQAGKFISIPCGLTDLTILPARKPKWADHLDKPFFLYVGVFSENKNQKRLIETWAKLQADHPDLPALMLAGPSPERYFDRLIRPALRACPRPHDIVLPGRIANEELAWAYRHAIGYVQPSIAEGFGLPVIEAMSFGLPVACSNSTSLPEVAGDAALLFDPHDPATIARSVLRLWREPELRRTLTVKGAERCRQYTWRRSAELVAREIESVLGASPSAAGLRN